MEPAPPPATAWTVSRVLRLSAVLTFAAAMLLASLETWEYEGYVARDGALVTATEELLAEEVADAVVAERALGSDQSHDAVEAFDAEVFKKEAKRRAEVAAHSACRHELRNCKAGLCLDVAAKAPRVGCVRHTGGAFAGTNRTASFPYVLFPALPRAGSTHVRKLVEGVTMLVTESVQDEGGSAVRLAHSDGSTSVRHERNPRTGAWARPCGGLDPEYPLPLGYGRVQKPEWCHAVRVSNLAEPVFVKADADTEEGWNFVDRARGLLLLVRDPLDHYRSYIAHMNKQKSKRVAGVLDRLKKKMSLETFMRKWSAYVKRWELHAEATKIPTYIMRFEDLYLNSTCVIEEAFDCLGVSQVMRLSPLTIAKRVFEVKRQTQHLFKAGDVGGGFEVAGFNHRHKGSAEQAYKEAITGRAAFLGDYGYTYYMDERYDERMAQEAERESVAEVLDDLEVNATQYLEAHRIASEKAAHAAMLMGDRRAAAQERKKAKKIEAEERREALRAHASRAAGEHVSAKGKDGKHHKSKKKDKGTVGDGTLQWTSLSGG